MNVSMNIISDDTADEDLQKLTFELLKTVNDETEATAVFPESKSKAGAKGDAVALGQIVLTALTSGTVVALFGVIKAYFERKPSLVVEFTRPDGKHFKLKAEQLSKSQIDQTLSLAKEYFEDENG
jgi:hypothetical protein